jgi:hypothetical protein
MLRLLFGEISVVQLLFLFRLTGENFNYLNYLCLPKTCVVLALRKNFFALRSKGYDDCYYFNFV